MTMHPHKMNIPINCLPRTHQGIRGRLNFITGSGLEASLTVTSMAIENTNGYAIEMQKMRDAAAVAARRSGVPLGIDLNVNLKNREANDRIQLNIPGKVPVEVQEVGGGKYIAKGRVYNNLREMASGIMERYELEHNNVMQARAQHQAQAQANMAPRYMSR